jgi:dTDP-4-amino-4,6-dideoxygalactose transaminase
VARVGAKPVFVDIDPSTFNIDARKVEAAITKRTKAILPVHLFGLAADLSALTAIATAHKLAIIEDAAQSLGSTFAGRQVGTFGAFGCFSFFPSKNLGAFGDAGLLTTEDDELADRARLMRTHGGRPKYFHKVVGGNFRLDALQAALLRVKLPHVARYTELRREHAAFYDQQLAGLAGRLTTPQASAGHVYNQYVVRTPKRDALRAALTRAGIGTEVYYPRSLHVQECFADLGYQASDMPESERAVAEVLAIPVYPELETQQRARVLAAIRGYFEV